jgi:hypothetical protein
VDDFVTTEMIVARLVAKNVGAEDAVIYAAALLKSKSNTVHMLSLLDKVDLKEMEVATGDIGLLLEIFQNWHAELTSSATGGLSIAFFLSLSSPLLSLLSSPLLSSLIFSTYPITPPMLSSRCSQICSVLTEHPAIDACGPASGRVVPESYCAR